MESVSGDGTGVHEDGFSADSTRQALIEACEVAGFDSGGAELLRLGENAVWRLRWAPVVARIARTVDYLPAVQPEVAVARWLESAGFPAVRLARAGSQPIVTGGRVVTFWEQLAIPTHYGTITELGSLLRRLHDLTPPPSLALPELAPFSRAWRRIAKAHLSSSDRDFLRGRLAECQRGYARLVFALDRGPVHGDASIGNIICRQARKVRRAGLTASNRLWKAACQCIVVVSATLLLMLTIWIELSLSGLRLSAPARTGFLPAAGTRVQEAPPSRFRDTGSSAKGR